VRGHVREVLPNYLLEVFGSERTGLALAISDIDLRLYDASLPTETLESQLPPDVAQRRALLNVLHDLRKALVRRPEYSQCEITYSRIPLIDLVDKETKVRVQIVLSNDTSLARENMAKYMRDYPCLREVFMLIKSMFEIRCLTDVFYGGFGTYSLFYMIVASILQAQKENPKLYKNPDAATVFLKFLGFWGSHRTDLTGISIEPFHMFPKDKEVVMNDRTKSRMTVCMAKYNVKPQVDKIRRIKRSRCPTTCCVYATLLTLPMTLVGKVSVSNISREYAPWSTRRCTEI
jgi:non-canonical poly(A) RNA polymerase PAPD5/7